MKIPILLRKSASDLLRLYKARNTTPTEVLQIIFAWADRVEPTVNAFVTQYREEALALAAQSDKRYAEGKRIRPLEGIPISVKDDTPIRDKVSTMGSLIYRDTRGSSTNPSVERLINAGAIIHARTACPEFCWAWFTDSRINGVTRNPWDPEITPGGSSGGSAAALAAGTTFLATGTDSAGSIRQPAALCGIVGFKPPYGRNPWSPWNNLDMYNQIGPMARSVEDCIRMQNVMSGPHPLDHATVRPKQRLPLDYKPVTKMKIAYSLNLDCYEVDPAITANTLRAIEGLKDVGAQLQEVPLPWVGKALEAAGRHSNPVYSPMFLDALEHHPDLLCDYTTRFAEEMKNNNPRDLHEAYRTASNCWLEFGPLLNRFDAFICPTVAANNMPAAQRPWEAFSVNGKLVDGQGGWVLTPLFNMFSRCPALSVPSGFSPNGIPTGIQIVARPFSDARVFRVAKTLESLTPWLTDKFPKV